MRFTLTEVLKANGHTIEDTPTEVKNNLLDLIERVNKLEFAEPMIVSSGYRTPEHNKRIGGAPNSAHCQGKAIDIRDPHGQLKQFICSHTDRLAAYGLRMEDPVDTGGFDGGWCHLDTMPVKNRRIFRA